MLFHLREIQVDKAKVNIIQSFIPLICEKFVLFLGMQVFIEDSLRTSPN
jgi:hypothetical protein